MWTDMVRGDANIARRGEGANGEHTDEAGEPIAICLTRNLQSEKYFSKAMTVSIETLPETIKGFGIG